MILPLGMAGLRNDSNMCVYKIIEDIGNTGLSNDKQIALLQQKW